MTVNDTRTEQASAGPRYESRDARFKNLMLTGAGLYGLIVVGLLLSWGIYRLSRALSPTPSAIAETTTMAANHAPEPRLQPDPHADLLALRASEDSVLGSYAWVNRDSGTVRIPIERAMRVLAALGLPVRQPADSAEADH